MGDLTRNLSRHEFACKCGCGFDTVDYELVKAIQAAVTDFELKYHKRVVVVINGGNRCATHNANTKGAAKNSKHKCAIAADHKFYFIVGDASTQIDPEVVYQYYDSKYPNKFGIGQYSNRTHLDVRATKARWDSR